MKLVKIATEIRCWILVTGNWLSNHSVSPVSLRSPCKKVVTSKCSSPHLGFCLCAVLEGPTTPLGYKKGPAEIRDFVLISALLNEETKLNCFVYICCFSPFTLGAFWKRLCFVMFSFSAGSTVQLSPLPRAHKSYHTADTFPKKEFPPESDN